MIIQEVYDFETCLSNGNVVTISVELEYEPECDCFCSDETHAHVTNYDYITIVDEDTGLDIQFTDELKAEIDSLTDANFYAHLERESEDLECVG